MGIEIRVILRETIKPSLPTADERKTFKLCLFDVFQLNTYVPLILFYPKTNDLHDSSYVISQLKQSLSEALTIFYPLAGRRKDLFSIDCNDEGAPFLEAKVNTTMAEFLKPPKLELMKQLIPCESNKVQQNPEALPQVLVQLSIFNCGGFAIGLCLLHTLLDGCSISTFLKTWAAICSDLRDEISCPDFSSAYSLFPPRNTSGVRSGVLNMNSNSIEARCNVRRILFNTKAINDLKAEARAVESSANPSRYEALSAFICKHMILACQAESGDGARPAVALHVVDMRRRIGEPFSENSIGNLLWPAVILYDKVDANTDIRDLVRIMKENLGKLSKELFSRLQGDPNFMWGDECAGLMLEGIERKNPISFVFTSVVNMGFNELNFGWGKPLWAGFVGGDKVTIPNTILLIETNEGIEAWVTMAEQHITILEKDRDFLKYAMLNPCISNI